MPRDYEMALIVDTQLSDDGVDKAVKRYEALLDEQGADVVNVDRWGARKLAYEIRKRQQGNYTFFYFQADRDKIGAVDRTCRLDEEVLRHLILQLDIPPQPEPAEPATDENAEEVEDDVSEEEEKKE